ncbi:MAG: hypothetical protein EWM47_00925 [Anaerolineaceae bacterium]|nr:MAG: hypothetical protein EWM47_00925 [Anaerolineaceae bacterium]
MRIKIKNPGSKDIKLAFPTRMIFNGFTARIGAASINKYVSIDNKRISHTDLKRLMKEVNNVKSRYPDLELVNVEASDGTSVIITL